MEAMSADHAYAGTLAQLRITAIAVGGEDLHTSRGIDVCAIQAWPQPCGTVADMSHGERTLRYIIF